LVEFSGLFPGSVGLAVGRSESVEKLFTFVLWTALVLRRDRAPIRRARALGQDAGRPRGVCGGFWGGPRMFKGCCDLFGDVLGPLRLDLRF